jgi:hypothetical protein
MTKHQNFLKISMSDRSNNDFLNIDSKFKKSSTFKGCDLENYDDDFFYEQPDYKPTRFGVF